MKKLLLLLLGLSQIESDPSLSVGEITTDSLAYVVLAIIERSFRLVPHR